jgi:hypothetical protein
LTKQGVATTPEADLFSKGRQTLHALATVLGDKTYILGTKAPTDTYHLFFNIVYKHNPWTLKMKEDPPTLIAYTERSRVILFPEAIETKDVAKKTQ